MPRERPHGEELAFTVDQQGGGRDGWLVFIGDLVSTGLGRQWVGLEQSVRR